MCLISFAGKFHHQHQHHKHAGTHSFQPSQKLDSKVSLWQGDITELKVDAIVNSIHGDEDDYHRSYLRPTTTVADCIYIAGGKSLLQDLAQKLDDRVDENQVMVTKGYELPAKCELYSHVTYFLAVEILNPNVAILFRGSYNPGLFGNIK